MENQNYSDMRKMRGLQIAKTSRIIRDDKGRWKVPSQSGHGLYTVKSDGYGASCNCPDFKDRGCKCKHIWAVELIVTQEVDKEGNVTITQKITYTQDWKNYNLAQTQEKEIFMKLLGEITSRINNPNYNFGRPTNLLSDMIYSMVFKVYSGFSGRRFNTDMREAKNYDYITKNISYNSMFDYFNKKDLTTILASLVTITSLPLREVENSSFNIDSTGFGTSQFQ